MYSFLLVILIVDAVILATAVLMQAGKGGGLAANFGGASSSPDAFVGTRQAGNILTKASWWCGGIFIFLAFVLQIMTSRSAAPTSVLDRALGVPTAPAPGATGIDPSVQSAVPLQPAPPPAGIPTPPPQP